MDKNILLVLTISATAFMFALYYDLRYKRIPNRLCLFVLILGVITQMYFFQLQGLTNALLGGGVAFILLFPIFLIKALGAGDVKLMIAIGTLVGPYLLAWSIAYAIVFGAITSVLLAFYKTGWKGIKATVVRYYHCLYLKQYFEPNNGEAASLRVPYAPALALGWLWACSQSDEVLWAISNVRYAMFS